MIDLLMTVGSLGALSLIAALGHRVYLQELNSRCGWCFGSGREWCEEYGPPCKACHGSGVTSDPARRTQKLNLPSH
jgi:DnaJ-class molecular chaperone